jgi:hypothetical protein
MKTLIKKYSVSLLLTLLVGSGVFAGEDPLVEKTKSFNKSYPLGSGDKVNLNNRFGKLKINVWDKAEVKVDITMTAKASTDERAQEILDQLEIDADKSGNTISVETDIKQDKQNRRGSRGDKESFNIDYEVYMPVKNALSVTNEFGSMTLPDYSGEITVNSKFGSLTTGKLSNAKKVVVEFGSASIEGMTNGELRIAFSRAVLNKLDGTVKASFEHCSGIKLTIDNNLKDLNLKNSFTTLYLDLDKSLSAKFDITTNFGELSNKSSFDIAKEDDDDDRRGPKFDYRYSGKAGAGNNPLKIRAEFSKIILGHNLTMTLQEDKKEKRNSRNI